MIETEFIVLSRIPYKENSVLLGGLSPDYGKVNLIAGLPKKEAAGDKPDLYRVMNTEFEEGGKGDLFRPVVLETVAAFDALADYPLHFRMAGKIGAFLLKNAAPALPMPFTYDTLKNVLARLCLPMECGGAWSLEQCAAVMRLSYLYENGLLPEISDAAQLEMIENLVSAGVENTAMPAAGAEYFRVLNRWLVQLCDYHQLGR